MADLYATAGATVEVTLAGAPTGLANVGFQVIDTPTGNVVVARTVMTEVIAGSGLYVGTFTAPALGTYSILYDSGTITPTTTAVDTLYVNSTGTQPPPVVTGDLITLAELKTALGIAAGDVDLARDAKLQQAITNTTAMISKYADRDFATALVTETRTFEYDSSGYLEIDDAAAVTSVTFKWYGYDQLVDPLYWRAEPANKDVATYLILPTQKSLISPEMGFTQNLDVLYRERQFMALPLFVQVNGTWGWPTVPNDVKQAAIWTAAQVAEELSGYRSESIESYSYVKDTNPTRGTGESAIPERAQDLLAPYVRWA